MFLDNAWPTLLPLITIPAILPLVALQSRRSDTETQGFRIKAAYDA